MPDTFQMIRLFEAAIRDYGAECDTLRPLAEARYDTAIFPTTGQYDWFSGQALYCLVRHRKPEAVVEISTSSGYSTLFMGLALRKYDDRVIGRLDRTGRPMEWNESLWTYCGPLAAAYRSEVPGGKPG